MNKILLSTLLVSLIGISNFAQSRSQSDDSTAKICDVIFKIEFLASGKIGDVSLVSDLCHDEKGVQQAFKMARNIKFEPAIKDGMSLTVTKTVKYSLTVYDDQAEAILGKAVQFLGGDKYLKAQSQFGRGSYSQLSGGAVTAFQPFVDVVVFPDKERTEFKTASGRIVQTNVGKTGWIFDGGSQTIKDQTTAQIEDYKRGLRVSLDNFLRGAWRGDGVLTYGGKRAGTLGKRNDVLKLTFTDEYSVEFEFTDDGTPVKALYARKNSDGTQTKEEDRYAQFADIGGIKTPFIIDRFTDNAQTSRINYESVEFNRKFSDDVFAKPKNVKEAKKDVKF